MSGSTPIPTTPPNTTATPRGRSSPTGIQLKAQGTHISPGRERSQWLMPSPVPALQIKRLSVPDAELQHLFDSVRSGEPLTVISTLHGLSDPNVRDPRTGETLVHCATTARAWRLLDALATYPGLAQVVDEPMPHHQRAGTVLAAQMGGFDADALSKWHRLLTCAEQDDTRLSSRLERHGKGVARRMKLALSPTRPATQDGDSIELADPRELSQRLRNLLEPFDSLLLEPPRDPDDPTKGRRYAEPSPETVAAVKEKLKSVRPDLEQLRSELGRWEAFSRHVRIISERPLRDPYALTMHYRNQATIDQVGDPTLLVDCLKQRTLALQLGSDVSPQTSEAFAGIMEEKRGDGSIVKMTQQQVLIAIEYFGRLPDQLLLDTHSFIRQIESTLKVADFEHGGRPDLLKSIAAAISQSDKSLGKASELRREASVRPKSNDTRPEASLLRRDADNKGEQAKAMRRQAQEEDFGGADSVVRRYNKRVEALFDDAYKVHVYDEPKKGHLNEAEEGPVTPPEPDEVLLRQADGMQFLPSYRELQFYVELDGLPRDELEIHPRHLMAACLTLARQYTGRQDNDIKSYKNYGDKRMVSILEHASARVLKALDYRLALHMVGKDENGRPLPDSLLYRSGPSAELLASSDRAPSLRHERKISDGASPRRSFGKWLSPSG